MPCSLAAQSQEKRASLMAVVIYTMFAVGYAVMALHAAGII
jgi:hypothetical protein